MDYLFVFYDTNGNLLKPTYENCLNLNASFKRGNMNASVVKRPRAPTNRLTILPEKHEHVIIDIENQEGDSEILKILKEKPPHEILELLKDKNLGKFNVLACALIYTKDQ